MSTKLLYVLSPEMGNHLQVYRLGTQLDTIGPTQPSILSKRVSDE